MPTSRRPLHPQHRAFRGRPAITLAAALALLAAGAAPAQQDTHYQVEVLVFLQPQGSSAELPPAPAAGLQSGEPEALREDLAAEPDAQPAAGGPATGLPAGFVPPSEPLALTAAAEALRRRGYQPLWHQAWIQPPGDRDGVVLPVLAALGQGRASPGLDGAISLTRGRFLHLGLDLQWQPGPVLEAEMSQRRRLRSGEEHYLDHPRLGVLALVRPVDYPAGGGSAPGSTGAP